MSTTSVTGCFCNIIMRYGDVRLRVARKLQCLPNVSAKGICGDMLRGSPFAMFETSRHIAKDIGYSCIKMKRLFQKQTLFTESYSVSISVV